MPKIVVSGYVSLDRIILIDNELKEGHTSIINNHDNSKIYYGGCPVNIAYSLNKLNVNTLPFLRVGDDYESSGFKAFLDESNIPTEGITKINGVNTSNCYLVEDKKGNHHTIFYPGAMDNIYFQEMNKVCFNNAEYGILTVGPLQDNIEFLKKCKEENIQLVFGAKMDSNAFPKAYLKEALEYSSIIFCNEVEEKEITSILGLSSITDFFEIGNAKIIVVTYGTKGSNCYYKEQNQIISKHIDIVPAHQCIDTTGSGDAYMAGFMYGYTNNYSIMDSCKLGSTLSHFVVQSMGCITNIPSEEELLTKFKQEGEK